MKHSMKTIFLLPAIGFSLFFGAAAHAVTPAIDEVAKLVAGDAEASDYLGYSVAVDGDTALVGVYGDDDLGSEAGAAYVFTRDSAGVWSQQQKLTASDGAADDRFGWAVAVQGDTAVIGKESWDFFAPPPGAAYLFTRDSAGGWSEQQKLTAYDGEAGDYFGEALALSGDTVVVGAYGDDDMGDSSGSAYVFTRDSAGLWSLQQKLLASHDTSGENFGRSVGLDGDTAVISAIGYDYNGTLIDSGMAYVFTRDSAGVWSEQGALIPSDNADYNQFGKSVAVSGDTLVVGCSGDDQIAYNTGAAYVFTRDTGGVWSEWQKLIASDASYNESFGFAVDLDGDNLVVGAYLDDDNGTDSGSAYVFTRDAGGVWSEQLKLLASDGLAYDYFGGYGTKAVGISGSTVIGGAALHDTLLGANTGAAYLFEILPGSDGPDISLTPSAIDFGDVMVGQSAEQLVTVSNFGTAELMLFDIALANGVDYSQINDCPASLLPAEACQIAVTFAPTLDGVLTDTLTVLSDDPDQSSTSVTLSGSGITLLPDLTVTGISTPRTLTVGKLANLGMTIANQGSADVIGSYWVSLYLDNNLIAAEYVTDAPLAGTEIEFTWSVQIPDLKTGTYILEAVADMDDAVMELDEANNSLTKSVKIK
ncbi:MAG: choice-of-anchor D domain-containing protein [Pseudomonadota bacterium]